MSILEKFKDKQLNAQSMKLVKGGHEPAQWYSCVNETGHYVNVPVNIWESLEQVIDDNNSDSSNYAIVGCESIPS